MKTQSKFLKILIAGALLFIIFFIMLINQLGLTLNDLPNPTGNYSTGNTLFHWQNLAPNIDQKYKEFNVDVFYPIKKSDSLEKYDYQPEKIKALIKVIPIDSHLPEFIWKKLLTGIHTFTKPNAPIINNETNFPAIIYLPGINSEDLHNLYLEELASHGYIIFAIEPPYDLMATVFPGNKIIEADPILKKAVKENNRNEIYKYRNTAHVRWNQYIESAIQHIKDLNNDQKSMFYQKINTENIGLIGHSHGGAVVTDFCQKNKLCKAGINMDGWTKTYNSGQKFDVPFLFMLAELGEIPELQELFKTNSDNKNFQKAIIKNADHGSFTDGILAKKPFTFIGTDKKENLRHEIGQKIVTFFNKYLK